MYAMLQWGRKFVGLDSDGNFFWTDKPNAHKFQDVTAARSYRDYKRLPVLTVKIVDENGSERF